jgi:hypothetical protein
MDGSMGHQIPGGKIRKERRKGSTVHAATSKLLYTAQVYPESNLG